MSNSPEHIAKVASEIATVLKKSEQAHLEIEAFASTIKVDRKPLMERGQQLFQEISAIHQKIKQLGQDLQSFRQYDMPNIDTGIGPATPSSNKTLDDLAPPPAPRSLQQG